jgi:DNA-binding NarL/FixJ family response regulator
MNKISVVLVDDDALIVSLLSDFLIREEGIDVIYTCHKGEELLQALSEQKARPDVLILDLNMGGINGADVTKILKADYPSVKTVIMSSHYKKSFMGFMLKTGVSGFVPKGISPQQLVEIIKEVHAKGVFFLPDQLDMIREQLSAKSPQPILDNQNGLSEREIEVLKLICFQKTAKEIAEQLFLSARTVEGHKNNLFVKTGAKNIAGLVIYAIQNHIIEPEEMPLI